MSIKTIDGSLFRDMLVTGCTYLNNNREAVDALNVFPVPDGDTGTNMSQTMNSATKDLGSGDAPSVSDIASKAAKGALRGARGNSGVILSQILRGFASAMNGHETIDVPLMTEALRIGANTAYKAVMKPKEGTILTVARVMAEDAERFSKNTDDMEELYRLVIKSGEEVLERTPDMLPVLKQAGVVDSGGKGLMTIFHGFFAALTGNYGEAEEKAPALMQGQSFIDNHDVSGEINFGYCTEFIVSRPKEDLSQNDVNRLRKRLERIGDCVFVVSDLSVVKVHVHTNDPGRALQMGLELGELDSIKIDNMFEEHRKVEEQKAEQQKAEAAKASEPPKQYGMVAVSLGDGFRQIFESLEVDQIVDGGQTMNPSIEDLQKAIEAANAENVYVLPNNSNIILAAQQAAEICDKNVMVIPTKSVPMGIAAALTFSRDAEPQDNFDAMKEAAEKVHTASVTYSVRDTVFDGMEIHEHDIMGLVDNRIKELGSDVREVALKLLEGMVTEDCGVITVYYGSDIDEATASALSAEIEKAYTNCEVYLEPGGQPLYYYLIAVE
ncbi:MAG: DAK2 domain-containing protein [Clostridia bacterium]|nr:DAK2 domain-containing protein [Clostridia bacterium]